MTYRIGVTASRYWTNEYVIHQALRFQIELHGAHGVIVKHGACPTGGDLIADRLLRAFWPDIVIEQFVADWDRCGPDCSIFPHRRTKASSDIHHPGMLPDYCPGAGPRRNREMVQSGLDILLGFPLSERSGTIGCMNLARAAGISVRRFKS